MAAHSLHSRFAGLSLTGGLCEGARIGLKDIATGGWVRMEPSGEVNAKGSPKELRNWPGEWAIWTVEEADDGAFKLRSHTGKYIAIKPDGRITDGGGGKHCHFKFEFNKDAGTVLIQSTAHAGCGLGFLANQEPARDAHNVSLSPGPHNQFKVIFEGMSDLEAGTRVHFRNSKSGKNVALMPNGKIHAHGGNGKHATFEVFHHPFNGRFKFFNESGHLGIHQGELKSTDDGKWAKFYVKPVESGLITIQSIHADGGEKAGVGFDEEGEIRPPGNTGMGHHGQFEVIPAE